VRALLQHPRRVWQLIGVAFRFYLAPSVHFGRGKVPPGPIRTRLALEELGGAWIKLGQMLAMRFDLLPAAYCNELFKLLNRVRPFPYEQVRQIIRQELGDWPEDVFDSFEAESFAAASIGQVHRAVLPSGETVAVKIQRPRIREILQSDIDLMYAVTWVLDLTHAFGTTQSRQVIDEFARWTADELDYLVEARQAVVLRQNARGDRLEKIARVQREYTTSRVFTAEFISGIPLIEIISAIREGNDGYIEDLVEQGYDLNKIVRHLDWNMLNEVYVYGYFHADLHPANVFVLPGNGIGYVDYGIVGQLPDRVRRSLTYYTWRLFKGDTDAAVRELMRWMAPTSATDAAAARRDLARVHDAFLYNTAAARRPGRLPGRPGVDVDNPYSKLAVDTLRIIRVHELQLSQSLLAYLKMLVTLGTLRHQLATDYDLAATVQRFFRGLTRQEAINALDPRLAIGRAYDASVRVNRAIEFVEFLEAQEPAITAGVDSLFGIRGRLRRARRRLISLGLAVLVVGLALYFVLADPDDTRRMLPTGLSYSLVHGGLVILLLVLIASLVLHLRQFGRQE
jgi:predicted unusual protein kinase regulating ubiquinone biosynthesis (AarF/ABC1/UbiB family)